MSFMHSRKKPNQSFSPFQLLLSACLRVPKISMRSDIPSTTDSFNSKKELLTLNSCLALFALCFAPLYSRKCLQSLMSEVPRISGQLYSNLLHKVLFPFLNC